jgi:GTPase
MFRIAIVGRPNVGKSALLNRLARRRVSIVYDQPGVTRDRITAVVNHEGSRFELIDTGGIGLFENETTPNVIASAVEMQVEAAVESADVVLFVVDGLHGLHPLDHEIAKRLRKRERKVWLLINKVDLPQHELHAAELIGLGMEPFFYVSASHGRGVEELWDRLVSEARMLEAESRETAANDAAQWNDAPKIAVVGRPNVGKSSLTNRLLGAERVIVSEVPGTTRDPVELPLEVSGKRFILIDTAGVRQKAKIHTNVEMYSRHGTELTIKRSDLVLLVLSAEDGATRQDKEIASMILEYRKPCIILVNKWDLNEKVEPRFVEKKGEWVQKMVKRRESSQSEYEKELRYQMPFLEYSPVMFVSALEGYHAREVWKVIDRVRQARSTTFTTGVLNRVLTRAHERVQPPMRQGKRLKIYYATQKADAPVPTFVLFVNQLGLLSDDYQRYLKNQLREVEPMTGCPIFFELRQRALEGDDKKSRQNPTKSKTRKHKNRELSE